MPIAWKRTFRQFVGVVLGLIGAYYLWRWLEQSSVVQLVHPKAWNVALAILAFFLIFYLSQILLRGKAAR